MAVEDNGRTGTTEPGAAATFMSFEYMILKGWLYTHQEIACQKKQGSLSRPAARGRRSLAEGGEG